MQVLNESKRIAYAFSVGFDKELAMGGSGDLESTMVVYEKGKTRGGDFNSLSYRQEMVEDLAVCEVDDHSWDFHSPLNYVHPCSNA